MKIFFDLFSISTSDNASIAICFCFLGIITHLSILSKEIDSSGGSLLIAFGLGWLGLATTWANTCNLGVQYGALKASIACSCFIAGILTSTAIYRLMFHRLRSFPGPWGAKLSRFYAFSMVKASDFKYHLHVESLHRQYGDFVRTGPRELSINRSSAVRIVHGQNSVFSKTSWYSQMSDNPAKVNLLSVRDSEIHRLRRKAWDRSLGPKALATYQPDIQEKVDTFMDQLNQHLGQVMDISKWTMYFSFDIMGRIAFSKDFYQLNEAKEHFAIAAMHDQMAQVGLMGSVPWLMHIVVRIPFLGSATKTFFDYTRMQIDQRRQEWRRDSTKTPTDIISWLLKATDEDHNLGPSGDEALCDDGRLAIIAGSDTTGSTLANVLYFLTANPDKYERLQKDIDEASQAGDYKSHLPYLEAIVAETLRLKPVVPGGQPRETPPEGLFIDEVWIPGKINILVPQWVIQRDERNYERPLEFLPERWMEEGKHLTVNDQAYFPFSIGAYGCSGKQLALLQMRTLLRRIASEFDISFAPGEDGREFDTAAKDTFTLAVPPLFLIFRKRGHSVVEQ